MKKADKNTMLSGNGGMDMEIKISLSTSDLERIKDTLGITSYDDIHTAIVEAFDYMLEKEEKNCN